MPAEKVWSWKFIQSKNMWPLSSKWKCVYNNLSCQYSFISSVAVVGFRNENMLKLVKLVASESWDLMIGNTNLSEIMLMIPWSTFSSKPVRNILLIAKLNWSTEAFSTHSPTASRSDCLQGLRATIFWAEIFCKWQSLVTTTKRKVHLSWYLLQMTILGKVARLRSAVEVFREVVTVASW